MSPSVALVLLTCFSSALLQPLQLQSYDKNTAREVFERRNGMVYERLPTASVLSFDEYDKEVQIILFYIRGWQDTTLPKFKGKYRYFINDDLLWQPAPPYVDGQYSLINDRLLVRGDNTVLNIKFISLKLPCHRLTNYRYPKDRFQCFALHNTWEPPRHRYACIKGTLEFSRNSTFKTVDCQLDRLPIYLDSMHSYLQTSWKLVGIRAFPGDKARKGPKALEVDLERFHPHFFIAEVLAALAVGAVVLCQSLLPAEMGQRLLLGGFGTLITLMYWSNVVSLPVVELGFEDRLPWLALGLIVLQAWNMLLSVLSWNLCQCKEAPPLYPRALPLIGTKLEQADVASQWRDTALVVGRLSFVLELIAFFALMCFSLPT